MENDFSIPGHSRYMTQKSQLSEPGIDAANRDDFSNPGINSKIIVHWFSEAGLARFSDSPQFPNFWSAKVGKGWRPWGRPSYGLFISESLFLIWVSGLLLVLFCFVCFCCKIVLWFLCFSACSLVLLFHHKIIFCLHRLSSCCYVLFVFALVCFLFWLFCYQSQISLEKSEIPKTAKMKKCRKNGHFDKSC